MEPLAPEEQELIEVWRRARLHIENGNAVEAANEIDHCKRIIGEVKDYTTETAKQ